MTRLTVPVSQAGPGQAARPVMREPGGGGAALGELGQRLLQVGTRLEDERLGREMQRHTLDLQREMNALRLETEAIGEPDRAEAHWQSRVQDIRAQFEAPGPDGRPRLDPKNVERFDLAFTDLRDRHAFALGRRTLGLRMAERQATTLALAQETQRAYATGDPDMQDLARQQYLDALDDNLANGVIDAAERQRLAMQWQQGSDNARAIALLEADPEGFKEAAAQNALPGLSAETLARYNAQADRAIARRDDEAAKAIDQAAAARQKAIGERLTEIRKIADTGRGAVDEAFLSDAEVQAHPEFARTQAALALREEGKVLGAMSPRELARALEDERGQDLTFAWQAEREALLREALAEAERGYGADPVGTAIDQGLELAGVRAAPLPAFDPEDPAPFTSALRDRVVLGEAMRAQGYTRAPAVLSSAELEELRAQAGPEADPRARAALAAELPSALGARLDDLGLDPVFGHMSGFLGGGGSRAVAEKVFRGQQVIEAGNVVLPPARDRLDPAFEAVADIFADLDGGEALQRQVLQAADAHYAATVRRSDPGGDIDAGAYRQAIHEVMGGSGRHDSRDAAGGVQDVRGRATILPPGLRAQDAEGALDVLAFAARGGDDRRRTAPDAPAPGTADDIWRRVTGGRVPRVNGQPLTEDDLRAMQIEARAPGEYILTYELRDGRRRTVYGDDGQPLAFDLYALVREAGR